MTYEEFTSKFKKGDIIKRVDGWIFMYNSLLTNTRDGLVRHVILYDCLARLDSDYTSFATRTGIGCIEGGEFELATNKEIQQMIEKINKKGYDWDFDEQKLNLI